jgi:hypothetical protein
MRIDPPTLVCTEAGVFAWPGYALVERRGASFIRASEREIGNLVGSLCGASAIYGSLIPMLDRAARWLERGEVAKARACIASLRIPPRSPEIEKFYLRGALDQPPPFAKVFNPDLHPRWPAGQSDGGQFRPADSDSGGGNSESGHGTNVAARPKASECNDRCYRILLRPKPYSWSPINKDAYLRCFHDCMAEDG